LRTPHRQDKRRELNDSFDERVRRELSLGYRPQEIAARLVVFAMLVSMRAVSRIACRLLARIAGGRLRVRGLPQVGESLFTVLIGLYPRGFREEFGNEMLADFRQGARVNQDQFLPWLLWQTTSTAASVVAWWAKRIYAALRTRH
jgi:hypothetical protein